MMMGPETRKLKEQGYNLIHIMGCFVGPWGILIFLKENKYYAFDESVLGWSQAFTVEKFHEHKLLLTPDSWILNWMIEDDFGPTIKE